MGGPIPPPMRGPGGGGRHITMSVSCDTIARHSMWQDGCVCHRGAVAQHRGDRPPTRVVGGPRPTGRDPTDGIIGRAPRETGQLDTAPGRQIGTSLTVCDHSANPKDVNPDGEYYDPQSHMPF